METTNTKRLEWLDAMRGFTMILVVAYHVAQSGFAESEKISASLPFLVLFRMPLFFFVSGFLAYKPTWIWTPQSFASLTWKKIKVQILPTLVFLCIFIVLRVKDPFAEGFMNAMRTPTKDGYWFTWVLLQMFLIYYVVAAFFQSLGKKAEHIAICALWVISLAAYVTLYLPKTLGNWWKTDWMMYSSFYETLKFMHFFLMGNLVHRHWNAVQRLFDAKGFFVITVTLAFLCCADIFKWHFIKSEWTNLPKTMAMYTLMFVVIMSFRHYQSYFTRQNRLGKGLQYIGTRTLDVYLLHFILLPYLPEVGKWLNDHHPNFVLDIVLSVGTGLIIIAFCLLISNVLRISPFLKEYLFGRKEKKSQETGESQSQQCHL
ncbi:MAG: acyltransferase family protein [Bacteroidales bacterium]|nr:acyltransferase family protein [Bacteroidales bacterium]